MTDTRSGIDRRELITAGLGAAVGVASTARDAPAAAAAVPAATGVRTATLPRGGKTVPALGMGTVQLNPHYTRFSVDQRVRLARYAYDRGIRYFDTANAYATEVYLGQAFRDVRDKVSINTKTGARDRTTARGHVEQSLRDLQTDVLDCVKVHCPSDYDAAMTVLDELDDLRAQGKIRNVGMSNHVYFETAYRLVDAGRLDEVLIARCRFPLGETNILSPRNAEYREMTIARAHELGMNIIGMKAMGGWVFGHLKLYAQADSAAASRQLAAAAIRWCFSDPRFHVYIVGCSIPSDIDHNLATCSGDMALTDSDRQTLAGFCARVWQSDLIGKAPEVFPQAETSEDIKRIRDQRQLVMADVDRRVGEVWDDHPAFSGLAQTW